MTTHESIQYLCLQSEAVFDKMPIKLSSDSQSNRQPRMPWALRDAPVADPEEAI